jgi:ABC-type transport system substrate-binding protein
VTGPVKIVMKVLPRADTRDIAQIVQQQLAAGGFEVELVNQEIGQFVQDWRNSDFDMFVSANGGSVDPDQYFYRTFYSGGSTNVFKYDDAGLNKLLDDGRTSIDRHGARKAAYDEAQRQLACSGPVAHIAYGTLTTATGPQGAGLCHPPVGPSDRPAGGDAGRMTGRHGPDPAARPWRPRRPLLIPGRPGPVPMRFLAGRSSIWPLCCSACRCWCS